MATYSPQGSDCECDNATSKQLNATSKQLNALDLSADLDHLDHSDGGKKHKSLHYHFFHFHLHHKHKNGDKHDKTTNGDKKKSHDEDKITTDKNEDRSEPNLHEKPQHSRSQDTAGKATDTPKDHDTEKEEHPDTHKDHKHNIHFHGLGFKPMSHCLDFRTRTVSFDLHNIGQTAKMSLLSKLLNRSKSESSMKVPPKKEKDNGGSPSGNSPKQSPAAPAKRRFVRVVRDDQCVGEEYVNPHVTRRFSKNHWEQRYLKKSASLDEGDEDRPLPYTVTGHTILKKHHSVDADTLCAETNKHAKFNEEVEVLEYDIKGKILAIHSDASILHAKLHDGEIVQEEVILSRDACDAISVEGVEVELQTPSCLVLDSIAEAVTPTDLSPDSDVTDTTVLTEGLTTKSDSEDEDLVSDSVFDDAESEHAPKASRQISTDDECSVKKSKLENGQLPKRIDSNEVKLKAVES